MEASARKAVAIGLAATCWVGAAGMSIADPSPLRDGVGLGLVLAGLLALLWGWWRRERSGGESAVRQTQIQRDGDGDQYQAIRDINISHQAAQGTPDTKPFIQVKETGRLFRYKDAPILVFPSVRVVNPNPYRDVIGVLELRSYDGFGSPVDTIPNLSAIPEGAAPAPLPSVIDLKEGRSVDGSAVFDASDVTAQEHYWLVLVDRVSSVELAREYGSFSDPMEAASIKALDAADRAAKAMSLDSVERAAGDFRAVLAEIERSVEDAPGAEGVLSLIQDLRRGSSPPYEFARPDFRAKLDQLTKNRAVVERP